MLEKSVSNSKRLKELRRALRNNPTPAESELWKHLKADKLDGLRWRRQFSVEDYIMDFYCPAIRLCIELDGNEHFTMQGDTADFDRTEILHSKGIKVLRFENREIWESIERVLEHIRDEIKDRKQELQSKVFIPQAQAE